MHTHMRYNIIIYKNDIEKSAFLQCIYRYIISLLDKVDLRNHGQDMFGTISSSASYCNCMNLIPIQFLKSNINYVIAEF